MIRVGAVEYTNTLPLAHGLEEILSPARVVREVPGRVAELLESGAIEVGLVPVAVLAGHPEWPIVSGLGIASDGPVASVLLLSRRPLSEATRLAADPASRTSNVLARLWLEHRLGRALPVETGAASLVSRLAAGEPTVAIGDDALFFDGAADERIDLGEAWTAWTGLPFVYAVWAGPGAADPEVVRALHACYARNRERIPDLARLAGGGDAAREARVLSYLTRNIRHEIGPRESDGLRTYFEFAQRAGLLPVAGAGVDHAHVR